MTAVRTPVGRLLDRTARDGAPGRSPRAAHQPDWPDRSALRRTVAALGAAPALVSPDDCESLRERLAAVVRGEAFLLQGGECAETFARARPDLIAGQVRFLTDLAGQLSRALRLPVVTVGRIAGQYAKPRSDPEETRHGLTLPSYCGDAVNGVDFTVDARIPDPARMSRMYQASAATLAALRAARRDPSGSGQEFYTSHEALLLDYEQALAREHGAEGRYGLSGHLLWIGERTRQPEGAHVDFAASIRNPVGVKIGPTTTPGEVRTLIGRLDPDRTPGRLTLIARMGADRVGDALPRLVEEAVACGSPAVWVCDPMHGNTFRAPSGHKTRAFDDILKEVEGFFAVHRAIGTRPGGLHLELTADPVTECVGGAGGPSLDEVPLRYETACDPRLNRRQAAELVGALRPLATVTVT